MLILKFQIGSKTNALLHERHRLIDHRPCSKTDADRLEKVRLAAARYIETVS